MREPKATENQPLANTNIPTFSVSDLNRQARLLLEQGFAKISVEGEISNFVCPSSGHWYFTLKDASAQVRCALFKNRNRFLKYLPKNGDHVRLRAKVSLYEGRGEFQLIGDYLEEAGAGALQAAFEALKAKLNQEGLFSSEHKQPLPEMPRHIGVITSPTGAAIHDILSVLKRRFPSIPVSIYPTAVQGVDAPQQLINALNLANTDQRCDVLIIGRGGGSLEDLWAFNNEYLARAIFASQIPIVSAVGHEVDFTISDFVADLRAPTPSAAAEQLSPEQHKLIGQFEYYEQRLHRQLQRTLDLNQLQLEALKKRLRHPGQRLQDQSQRLDQLEIRLKQGINQQLRQQRNKLTALKNRRSLHSPKDNIQHHRERVAQLQSRLQRSTKNNLQSSKLRLASQVKALQAISPLATLERGYAIVCDDQGRIIQQASLYQSGDKVDVRVAQGALHCTVDKVVQLNRKSADK